MFNIQRYFGFMDDTLFVFIIFIFSAFLSQPVSQTASQGDRATAHLYYTCMLYALMVIPCVTSINGLKLQMLQTRKLCCAGTENGIRNALALDIMRKMGLFGKTCCLSIAQDKGDWQVICIYDGGQVKSYKTYLAYIRLWFFRRKQSH